VSVQTLSPHIHRPTTKPNPSQEVPWHPCRHSRHSFHPAPNVTTRHLKRPWLQPLCKLEVPLHLQWIQKWYTSRTDDDWEHQFGLEIGTLDNPGWVVKIDVKETPWQYAEFSPVNAQDGVDNWLTCEVKDGQFIAFGDSMKLETILTIFKNWILKLQFTEIEKSLIKEFSPSLDDSVLNDPIAEISPNIREQLLTVCRMHYSKYKTYKTKEAEEVLMVIGDIYSKLQ